MLSIDMEMLDLLFRFAGIGVLLPLCVHFAKERRGGWFGVFGSLFTFSIAAYLACSSPTIRPLLGWFFYPLLFAGVGSPVLFYLFARSLFDDEFEPRPWHGLALTALELTVFLRVGNVAPPGEAFAIALFAIDRLVAIGLAVSALVLALRGRMGDLIEGRRRFRPVFVSVVGVYVILVLSIEIVFADSPGPLWLDVLNAGAILAISTVLAIYLLSIRDELLFPAVASPDETTPATAQPARPRPDPGEQRLVEALQKAMRIDRLYRQEGLTIAALAKQLGTQEHRLRRLINQQLGYRNFAAFLNQHRIAEVSATLADPSKAHLPVLTIAMDAGYRSLGPFNQAFKRATGLTPTEFRRRHLAGGASPEA